MWMENVTWEGSCVNSCCRSEKTEKYNGCEGQERVNTKDIQLESNLYQVAFATKQITPDLNGLKQ